MASTSAVSRSLAPRRRRADPSLAASITRTASKQTYYTVQFFVDRGLVQDAFRAYAYFRWVDDQLDQRDLPLAARLAFAQRQAELIDRCYRGDVPARLSAEEHLLAELVRSNPTSGSGLEAYIRNMMAVMAFDAGRRGRWISQAELEQYTRWLAVGVTEALHYFIGNNSYSPQDERRYQAATAAHIAHMLRDTLEDIPAGYINIPSEDIERYHIDPLDVDSDGYRQWVYGRVQLAQRCFKIGRGYLAQVQSLRCRLAGYAYIARFETVLQAIARDGCRLRAEYPECKRPGAAVQMSWSVFASALRPLQPWDRPTQGQARSGGLA